MTARRRRAGRRRAVGVVMTSPRRRAGGRRAVLAAALALAAALGGCGVPTSSDVQQVGPGPATGDQSPDRGQRPPGPDAAVTPAELVENFLLAAAGNPETAVERAHHFIQPADRERWRPDGEIRVVRTPVEPVTTDAANGWVVELTVQPVGVLHPSGYLEASTDGETSYEFRVVTDSAPDGSVTGDSRMRLAAPPPVLLLDDSALSEPDYYFPTPIYFWDREDHDQLVPDLRWLWTAGEPEDQHPLIILTWLLGGPAPNLAQLQGMPPGTQSLGAPSWQDGNRLVVNLNAAALGGRDTDDLATQLDWSLLQLRSGAELELRIDDQAQPYTSRVPPWTQHQSVRLATLDGSVHAFADGEPVPLPFLSDEANTGVLAGALTRDGRLAAVVHEDGAGERLSVAVVPDGDDPVARQTRLAAGDITQPVWLDAGEDAVGLVAVDGDLYRFTADGDSSRIPVPGMPGPVTAIAVAPERRRVALVAGGELIVALLRWDGDGIAVENPQPLPTTVENLTGVAFSHENRLVIAGREGNQVGLYSLTVDGAVQQLLWDLGNATVTALVAHPLADQDREELADVMYEANGQTFRFAGAPSLVDVDDLRDVPDGTESWPLSPFFAD